MLHFFFRHTLIEKMLKAKILNMNLQQWLECILIDSAPPCQVMLSQVNLSHPETAAIRSNGRINCTAIQPKASAKHPLLPQHQPHAGFLHFQVFTSSESLSQPNQGVRWDESEPLTETLGRTQRCISPLSVETAWTCLISSLTETPRMESSLSARWDWARSLHAGKKFTTFKFWTKLIFPTCTSSLSSCEINVKNTKYSFVFHW